jgi:hypothetical protein
LRDRKNLANDPFLRAPCSVVHLRDRLMGVDGRQIRAVQQPNYCETSESAGLKDLTLAPHRSHQPKLYIAS